MTITGNRALCFTRFDAGHARLVLLLVSTLLIDSFASKGLIKLSIFGRNNEAGLEVGSSGSGSDGQSSPGGDGGGKGKAIAAGAGAASLVGLKIFSFVERDGTAIAKLSRAGRGAEELESAAAVSRAMRSDLSLTGLAGVGGDIVQKSRYLDMIGPAISDTPIASNLSQSALKVRWATQPSFRAEAINQLAEQHPEELVSLTKGIAADDGTFKPIAKFYNHADPLIHESDAITVAMKDEKTVLTASVHMSEVDAEGARTQFDGRVRTIVKEVLDELPESTTQPTNAELRAALTKALKPEPKTSYAFNVQTGKLTLKLRVAKGEVSGEPNIYGMIKKALYLTAVGKGVMNKEQVVQLAKKYFASQQNSDKATQQSKSS